MLKIGINGLGRIGRTLLRVLEDFPEIEVVQANDLADAKTLAHLIKYDSTHGRFPGDVFLEEPNTIHVGRHKVVLSQKNHPNDINWEGVDFVVEATGVFKSKPELEFHLKPAVKGVLLSVPPKDDSVSMIIMGVDETPLNDIVDGAILSNASCTTNCAAPMVEVIDRHLGIEQAFVTTVHSYTTDQRLQDAPHRDLRRARAAALSMVPTTTGAAKALSKVFPHLESKLGGAGIRVPVPNGSLTDITFYVKREMSADEVNALFEAESKSDRYKGVLGYTEDPLVSADIVGLKNSVLIDAQLTTTLGKMVKVVGWYDNEMSYSSRLANVLDQWSKKV